MDSGLTGNFGRPSRPPPEASTSLRNRATCHASTAAMTRYSRATALTTNSPYRTGGWIRKPRRSNLSTRSTIPPNSANARTAGVANASARIQAPS